MFIVFWAIAGFRLTVVPVLPRLHDDRVSIFVTYNSVENALAPVESPRPEFIASRDCRPVRPVEENALLELMARV